MKKPDNLEVKEWLCKDWIVGLTVEYQQTGTDTAETFWTLTNTAGESRRFEANAIHPLVTVAPDLHSVLQPTEIVEVEVETYFDYLEQNESDYALYQKLKDKFQ